MGYSVSLAELNVNMDLKENIVKYNKLNGILENVYKNMEPTNEILNIVWDRLVWYWKMGGNVAEYVMEVNKQYKIEKENGWTREIYRSREIDRKLVDKCD